MIVRHYCVVAKKMSGIEIASRKANASVLAAEIQTFLRGNDKNALAEIVDWQSASTEFGRQVARISVSANIVSDGIVDSAVRLGSKAFGLEATRVIDN